MIYIYTVSRWSLPKVNSTSKSPFTITAKLIKKSFAKIGVKKMNRPVSAILSGLAVASVAIYCFFIFGGKITPPKTFFAQLPAVEQKKEPDLAKSPSLKEGVDILVGGVKTLALQIPTKQGGEANVSGSGFSASLKINGEQICNICPPSDPSVVEQKKPEPVLKNPPLAKQAVAKTVEKPVKKPKYIVAKKPQVAKPVKKVEDCVFVEWQTRLPKNLGWAPARACVYDKLIPGKTLGRCKYLPWDRAYPALSQEVYIGGKWVLYRTL